MIYSSSEALIPAPSQDIVSFSFDKQRDYDEDAPLLVDADEPSHFLTARSYTRLVKRLIGGYLALGLQPGDCVLTHLPNSYFYPAIFFSIAGAGGIWTGSNPANHFFEISHFVQLAKPRFIITEQEKLSVVLDVCDKHQFPRKQVLVLDPTTFPRDLSARPADYATIQSSGTRSFSDLLDHGSQDWSTFTDQSQSRRTPAVYFPTSGTTGLPKLAAVSHHNLIVHHLSLHEQFPFETRRLISLPFFHLFATMVTFIQPIRYFQPTFIMKRFQLQKWLDNVERFDITELYGVPPMITATIRAAQSDGNRVRKLLACVRYLGVAGAPISAENINSMRRLLHHEATMTNLWGMTETGIALLFRHGENDESGSVGRLLGGYEAKLLDHQGRDTEEGKGELHLKTEGRMLGYIGLEQETDEWWATGDVCEIRGGKVYIVGRAKEMIKARGWQVAPAEVETVLLQHPDIIDAAVVGVLGADGETELPRAYVVRRRRQSEVSLDTDDCDVVSAAEVYQFAKAKLASYKALDGGVCFVEIIPRTPSGKIQRRKLSELHQYNGEIVRNVTGQTRMLKAHPPTSASAANGPAGAGSSSETNDSTLRRSPRLRGSDSEEDDQSFTTQTQSKLPSSKIRTSSKGRPSHHQVQKGTYQNPDHRRRSWIADELAKVVSPNA